MIFMTDQLTYERILVVGEKFARTRGYNGFSYADISREIGLSKATLHHHFATKADLGLKLIERFTSNDVAALQEIDRSTESNLTKLREYARFYEVSLHDNKMCLCGMFAAEHEALTDEMQHSIAEFFRINETWIETVLVAGKKAGEFDFRGNAAEHARLIVANLQGALLLSKSTNSLARMTAVASILIESYRAKEVAAH